MTALPVDEDRVSEPLRPVWLSHHLACDADRCVRIGSRHVCRRCLAMTIGFVPAALLLASSWSDDLQAGDYGLVLALTLLAGADFVQVVRRRLPYSARRVLVLSPAVGAVQAWLGATAIRDGFGIAHLVFGVLGLGALGVLVVNGTVVRSGKHS